MDEIYQATEGLLATTCSQGRLHLNEQWLIIEQEVLDEQRFIPVITDFSRRTQPIIRYRLDDILRRGDPCPCGSPCQTVTRIEGRLNDSLQLPARDGSRITLFADLCERALAQTLPPDVDYQLEQQGDNTLILSLNGDPELHAPCRTHLEAVFSRQGVDCARLQWTHAALSPDYTRKRRRICRP